MRGVAVACRRNTSSDFSSAGLSANTFSSQTIQSCRSPVSPSGIRRRRWPSAALTRPNTSAALAPGTLPTRWTSRGTASVQVEFFELAMLGHDPPHRAGDRAHHHRVGLDHVLAESYTVQHGAGGDAGRG